MSIIKSSGSIICGTHKHVQIEHPLCDFGKGLKHNIVRAAESLDEIEEHVQKNMWVVVEIYEAWKVCNFDNESLHLTGEERFITLPSPIFDYYLVYIHEINTVN